MHQKHRTTSTEAPLRIGLLLFSGCMPAGLLATADLLTAANLRAGRALFSVAWLSLDGQAVACAQGAVLQAQGRLDDTACDALLVPGLWAASEDALQACLTELADVTAALQTLPTTCALWSYCAGVALLAATGRLDGQPATATWWLGPVLRRRFPRVRWRLDASVVAARGALTAAGPSGYLPLIWHQLAQRLDAAALREIQDVLMLPQPRVRHPVFAPIDPMAVADPSLQALMRWAQRTPAVELTLAQAATHLRCAPRSLSRRVLQATGLTAADWLRRVKLRQVAEALLQGSQPLKTLAEDLGFSSEAALHRMFKQLTGLTPTAYRRQYTPTLSSVTR